MLRRLRRIPWRAIRTRLILAGIALTFIALFPNDTPAGNSLNDKVLGQAKDSLFNYIAWEAGAITTKLGELSSVAAYMTEAQRSRYVYDYFKLVANLQQLNAKLSADFCDPAVKDPSAASAELRTQRDAVRTQVDKTQPLAEAIIEGQVASVLRDEGFATLGEMIPAVSAHITELPMLLVVSPRHTIRFEVAVNVVNLPVDQRLALENDVDKNLNVSSLIAPLGGLSLYPSMIYQTWHAYSLFDVVAHEWAHHYLYFFPLGLTYSEASDARTINETTASLVGREVGRKVIERFYRDYKDIMDQIPPPTTPTPQRPTPSPTPTDPRKPPPFDYNATMHRTRITTDFLLNLGLVDLAERFMESQRLVFTTNGYRLCKINQAFFAFYGGYQSPGTGVGGSDPIGPAIAEIRQRSPSFKAWVETMRAITTREQLLAARDGLRAK
jgi:hypothetical protein